MRFKVAPLSGSFMLVAILGFLFSTMVLSKIVPSWAFSIGFLSVVMFIAAMISVTHAPIEEELALDAPINDRKKRVRMLSRREYLAELEAKKQNVKVKTVSKEKPAKKKVVKKKKTVKKILKKPVVKKVVSKKTTAKKKVVKKKK